MVRSRAIVGREQSIQLPTRPQHSITFAQHAFEIVDVLEYIVAEYDVEALVPERKLLTDANRKTDSLVAAESFNGSPSHARPKRRNVQADDRSRIPVSQVIGCPSTATRSYVQHVS